MSAALTREQSRAANVAFAPFAVAGVLLLVAARVVTLLAERVGPSLSLTLGIVCFLGALIAFCVGFYRRNRLRRRYMAERA